MRNEERRKSRRGKTSPTIHCSDRLGRRTTVDRKRKWSRSLKSTRRAEKDKEETRSKRREKRSEERCDPKASTVTVSGEDEIRKRNEMEQEAEEYEKDAKEKKKRGGGEEREENRKR